MAIGPKCNTLLYLHDSIQLLVNIYQESLFCTADSPRSTADLQLA